jgi:hypothetical protein
VNNLELIDWRLVGFSALWILGLSIILAAFGAADYAASQAPSHARTRDVLRTPGYQAALFSGMLLFCLGLLGSVHTWWEAALWLGLASAFAYQTWQAWHRVRDQ